MGDFKEPTSTTGDDYAYDANGNLTSDKNKSITSILYTHLNMPYEINIAGKGKITYTYDNLGNKLRKVVTDNTSGSPVTTTWLYIQNFVYKNDTMQFFSHEEGRARYDVTEGTGEARKFDFDYFVKDHLGNVRMVLTEELDTAKYVALTFEGTTGSVDQISQDQIWENKTGASINIVSSRIARPGAFGTSGTNGSYAMLVRKSTGAIGAGKLLKVMWGDKIHTQVDYFYTAANANNTGANGLNSLLANLATAMISSGQVSGLLKDGASALTSGLSGNPTFVNWLNTPNNTSGSNNAPKAYLNILFFDEQFRPDNVATQVIPVAYSPNTKATINRMFANAITARQNGYVYIYFSNESDEMVYFDNFILTHELSSLREETHYYPFGLTMAGISSRAIGKLENKFKFNEGTELANKEFSDGAGLEWYETTFRSYDPQIGRFHQIDPISEMMENWTPYAYANNNPLLFNDPLGLMSDTVNKPDPTPITPGVTPCSDCPTGSMATQQELTTVVVTAKKEESSGFWGGVLDGVQLGLDVAGLIPGLGEIADGANALIYLGRGDNFNAGLSAAAMVPFAGWAATGGKLANKAIKTINITTKAQKAKAALRLAERILGKGYKEIAPGVYRSADGLKQFRMTDSDLLHKVPHVNIEVFDPGNLAKPITNYHVPIIDP